MRRQLLTGLLMTIALTVLTGVLYPLAVWAVGQVVFKDNANGSFVTNANGQVVGSSLIGQNFVDGNGNPDPNYFQPRPSAAGNGYDPRASGGSNLGPSNPKLVTDLVPSRVAAYRTLNNLSSDVQVPIDAVTASASGLDPDISVANAKLQAARVAQARGMSVDDVMALVSTHTSGRPWGFLGEKVVNVLELNLDLDRKQ
ncbi:MAG TPA: K(+)-transporting ATPase subunit C [Acidimicrobiales bacterium]